jgi:hypothetical protein
MHMRRLAVIVPVLFALLAATVLFAAGAGKSGSARADSKQSTTTSTTTTDSSTSDSGTTGGTSDSWSGSNSSSDSEGSIGSNGSSSGGNVLDGVGETSNVDPGNRLSSARVIRQNVNDGEEEYMRFTFKDNIQKLDTSKASDFAVVGPDASTGKQAQDVRLDENHDNSVIAGFESGTDLKSYTTAQVLGGVVKNRDGQRNIADSVSLTNAHTNSSSDNRTAGPDLTKIRVSKNLNRVEYFFDENLDKGSANASDFGFYSKAGGYHTGSSIVSVYDRKVTVKFDSNDQVDTGQRWFATTGAVQDTNGTQNVLGNVGGSTDAPDLTSVTRDASDTMYNYKFDENVGDVTASDFILYTNDGTEVQATDINTDGDTVHATFSSDIHDYPKDMVVAAVNPSNASNDNNTSDSSNGTTPTVGAVDIGSSNVTRAGRTTGPDLTSVSKNADNQRITLTFDEKLDDSNTNSDASGIYLATSDNRLLQADSILSIDGKKVYVKASKTDIKALKGIVLQAGAVTDKAGNDNPLTTEIWGSGDTISGSGSSLYSHTTT